MFEKSLIVIITFAFGRQKNAENVEEGNCIEGKNTAQIV